MVFLALSFICSAILILLFKVFERTGTPAFQAIVFNYCTAAVCGFCFLPNQHTVTSGAIHAARLAAGSLGIGYDVYNRV